MSDKDAGLVGVARTPFKRDNETDLTYELKWAAWEWLYTVGQCRCIGMEVRLEGPAGRVVDLVGVGPRNTVYIVEVKASRSDFARDNHTANDLEELRAQGQVFSVRTRLAKDTLTQAADYAKKERPDCWGEVPAYRRALVDHRKAVQKEGAYRSRLSTYSIKFHDERFLAMGDYHYIIAPRGTVPRRWLPPQWGLLDGSPQITPTLMVPAPLKKTRKNTGIVSNVLRAIARSNTVSMMHAQGALISERGSEIAIHGPDEPHSATVFTAEPAL